MDDRVAYIYEIYCNPEEHKDWVEYSIVESEEIIYEILENARSLGVAGMEDLLEYLDIKADRDG